MTFTYNFGIPDGPNDPADDQPRMKTNFQTISDMINVDHAGFNRSTAGQHKQISFTVNQLTPPNGAAGSVLYTNTVSAISELFFNNTRANLQLTDLTQNAIPGGVVTGIYVDTPWNLRFMFGVTVNAIPSAGAVFTFPNQYASTPFVQISCEDNVNKTCTYSVLSTTQVKLFGFGTGGVKISIWVVGRLL